MDVNIQQELIEREEEGALLADPDSCAMCGERLVVPRVLSGLHVFCEQCLDKKRIDEAGDGTIETNITRSPCIQDTTIRPRSPSMPEEWDILLPQLAGMQEKSIKHSREKDAAVKRNRDLEMELDGTRHDLDELRKDNKLMAETIDKLTNERMSLQDRISELEEQVLVAEDEFDVEAHRISKILNIRHFGCLVDKLKQFAHEEPHHRMQLVLRDYIKQSDMNVPQSALENDAATITSIFPECSMEEITEQLQEIGNEENPVRIVVKRLLRQNSNNCRRRSSHNLVEGNDVVGSKRSKLASATVVTGEDSRGLPNTNRQTAGNYQFSSSTTAAPAFAATSFNLSTAPVSVSTTALKLNLSLGGSFSLPAAPTTTTAATSTAGKTGIPFAPQATRGTEINFGGSAPATELTFRTLTAPSRLNFGTSTAPVSSTFGTSAAPPTSTVPPNVGTSTAAMTHPGFGTPIPSTALAVARRAEASKPPETSAITTTSGTALSAATSITSQGLLFGNPVPQFAKGKRGGNRLLIDGSEFFQRGKFNRSTRYWYCIEKTCPSHAITKNKRLVKPPTPHRHHTETD